MGLDSVELVLSFEKYFNISIPDQVAEKIYTVQDTVEVISGYVKFNERGGDKKSEFIRELNSLLSIQGLDVTLTPGDKIFTIIPVWNKNIWRHLEGQMEIELPIPDETRTFVGKIWGSFSTNVTDPDSITVDRFADLTFAVNYKKMLNSDNITNENEVLMAVMGITIEQCGLDPYEVSPEKSYTNDLGID